MAVCRNADTYKQPVMVARLLIDGYRKQQGKKHGNRLRMQKMRVAE